LFCAQDEPFARDLLKQFARDSKLTLAAKFDTEANKSVGLYQEIVQDRNRPRADVFWNNEILGMIRLEEQGLLAPCRSPLGADDHPIPPQAVSKKGTWVALGSRARVLLVNTDLLKPEEYPGSLLDLTQERYRGKVVMAKPLHGMSATQAVCLCEVLGLEAGKKYFRDLKANGVHISPGNKQAAEWVGRGQEPKGNPVAIAVTDTDDALAEFNAGRPVKMIFPDAEGPPRAERLGTLFVPNTLGIIQGGPNSEGGQELIDFLLSPEVETALAQGKGAQIPVRKGLREKLPEPMLPALKARAMAVDFYAAAGLWDEVQGFLREEFAQ
jgi:iron(III) transport system substrate-binding protein